MQDRFWAERGIAYRINSFENSRETLVFIHGLGSSCSGWEPFERAFEDDYNVLTYDLRGHGCSQKYNDYADYELENLADDLRALLDYLCIGSCVLISHSMGTLVALLYICRHPGVAQKNLLLSPIYKRPAALGVKVTRRSSMLTKLLTLMPYPRGYGKRLDYSQFKFTHDMELKRFVPQVMNLSLRIYLLYCRQMNVFAHHALWSEVSVPTTIVHGTKDTVAPYNLAFELAKCIPHAKLVTLEGANHIVTINNKREIIAQIASAISC